MLTTSFPPRTLRVPLRLGQYSSAPAHPAPRLDTFERIQGPRRAKWRHAPTLRGVFERMAGPGGTITRSDFLRFAKRAGIRGLLGRVLREEAAAEFLESFDKDGSGDVTWDELRTNAAQLAPSIQFFDRADSAPRDGFVTRAELAKAYEDLYREQGAPQPKVRADVSTKLTFFLHDHWATAGRISRPEYAALLRDIERQRPAA